MKKINKNIIWSLLLLAGMMLAAGCQFSGNHVDAHSDDDDHHHEESETHATLTTEQMEAVGIQLGKVEHKELTATLRANGFLKVPNKNKGNATSMFDGVVKTLLIQVGDHVAKGQTIATVANPRFIQLQEEYLNTKNRIILAEQEEDRQRQLHEGNAGALRNLQTATAELNSLRAREASLNQQIQLMGISPSSLENGNLRSTLSVKSPVTGVVSSLYATIGSYVDVTTPVAEVVDNSSLYLNLQVYEKDLPLLEDKQIIHFTLTNNPIKEFDAEIFSIGSSFESNSKTIPVYAEVQGDKTGLIDGMNITGIVSLDDVTLPAVPNEAIVESEGKYFVFKVDEVDEEHKEVTFEKIEVFKGVSDMGYTAVVFVQDLPVDADIVIKSAFFINAKLTNTGDHDH